MNYLIDTNIVSEVRKGSQCDHSVRVWWESISDSQLFLSSLVIGEVRKGIELARRKDAMQAIALERWLESLTSGFAHRILPVTTDVAQEWGRINAIRPVPVIDALLAATALVHGLRLVTRNTEDVEGLGVDTLNPFEASE